MLKCSVYVVFNFISENIIFSFYKCNFSAVDRAACKLMRVEEMIIFKMLAQLEKDDFSVIFKKNDRLEIGL